MIYDNEIVLAPYTLKDIMDIDMEIEFNDYCKWIIKNIFSGYKKYDKSMEDYITGLLINKRFQLEAEKDRIMNSGNYISSFTECYKKGQSK